MANVHPQNFYKTELARALKENAFGLKGYQFIPSGLAPDSGIALSQSISRVELLEGWTVFLRLTYVGYEIVPDPTLPHESQSPQMEISETLDELLRALSPKFSALYSERLMSKLLQAA